MVLRTLHEIRRRARGLAFSPPPGGGSDAALLGRFVRARDEAAFELLVWSACHPAGPGTTPERCRKPKAFSSAQ